MSPLPLLFYPTQTMLLDDEGTFVEHMEVALEDELPHIKSFTDAQKALIHIQQNGISSLNSEKWIQPGEDPSESEEYSLSIRLQNLRDKMRDSRRSNPTTRVIVDYQMGSINGVEWCRQVTNPLVQKILLTGTADEQIGIEALNRGWIDMYVRKQDPLMLEKLISATQRAELQCFSKLTQGLHYAITQNAEDTALLDPVFSDFFLDFVRSNYIVEFYLIEAMGNFLMVDKDGRQSCLFVQTQAKADSNLQLVLHRIDDTKVRNDLETFKQIICCPAPQNFVTPDSVNYQPYLFPAQRLQGQQLYYWAITPNLIGRTK